jgi:hypothetical protein
MSASTGHKGQQQSAHCRRSQGVVVILFIGISLVVVVWCGTNNDPVPVKIPYAGA